MRVDRPRNDLHPLINSELSGSIGSSPYAAAGEADSELSHGGTGFLN